MIDELQLQYETFRVGDDEFSKKFTDYLNRRASEGWCVKHWNYFHGKENDKMYASCMFEQFVSSGSRRYAIIT